MIKRITHVKNFRCYQGWKHPKNTPDFAKLNLIYAPNGTGKSTFAELLSGVPQDPEWSHGMRARIQPGDDLSLTEDVEGPGHWIWDDVRLFNAEYVRRNLRFDAYDDQAPGADAPALVYLGKPTIEQKKRREQAQAGREESVPRLKHLEKSRGSIERKRDRLCTDLGRRANRTLGSMSDRFHRSFNKGHVKEALRQPRTASWELESTREQDRSLLSGSSPEEISPIGNVGLSASELLDEIISLLHRTVASQVLDELRGPAGHESWVREGLSLHGERETCLFCAGRISSERRQRLDRHFDEGYTRLTEAIDSAGQQVRLLRGQAERFSSALPDRGLFFEDLREGYDTVDKEAEAAVNTFLRGLERLEQTLERKRGAMFTPLELPSDAFPTPVEIVAVSRVIDEHNLRVQALALHRTEAADREFQRMLGEIVVPFQHYLDQEEALAREIGQCSDRLREYEAVLNEVPPEGRDPEHFVSTLNEDIHALLRRSDLTFEHREGRYQVLRHGLPARHLSEGEKTAIALIYFLQSLKEGGREPGRSIVVVDDPVSSLDEQLMFGIYATLIGRLDPGADMCRQLFVLTHNTSFLRHWAKELQRKNPAATLHLMKTVGSGTERSPVLDPVDPQKSSESAILETEYLLLFRNLAFGLLASLDEGSVGADLHLITSAPNDARKLLEHFLQFKAPKQGTDLTGAINHVLGNRSSLAKELIRFVHNHSHRASDSAGRPLLDPAVRRALTGVFHLVRTVDTDHFEGMCHRLGITDRIERLTSL